MKKKKGAVDIVDSASAKEMAYKTLKRLDQGAVKLIRATAKSQNVRAVAKDLAKITVSINETGIKINDDLKKTSASISEKLTEDDHAISIKYLKRCKVKKISSNPSIRVV